jgi:hypothetical protein
MSATCHEIYVMSRGQATHAITDWGKSTPGSESGMLKDGDTVASCAIVLDPSPGGSPTGSTTPTMGAVSVNVANEYVNSRLCSAGEATTVLITMGASQTYGFYRFLLTATTVNGEVIPRYIRVNVTGGG